MNLRLGNIKVPRHFIVVGEKVYEFDKEGEYYYSPEHNKVSNGGGENNSCAEECNDMSFPWFAGEYLQVTPLGDLAEFRDLRTVLSPAREGDVILITDGKAPRLRKVVGMEDDYDVLCQGEENVVKYGTYSLVVDDKGGIRRTDNEAKALNYLYKNGEDVATSLTYKIHEELRSDVPDYNKVNEMVRLVEYYREVHD